MKGDPRWGNEGGLWGTVGGRMKGDPGLYCR